MNILNTKDSFSTPTHTHITKTYHQRRSFKNPQSHRKSCGDHTFVFQHSLLVLNRLGKKKKKCRWRNNIQHAHPPSCAWGSAGVSFKWTSVTGAPLRKSREQNHVNSTTLKNNKKSTEQKSRKLITLIITNSGQHTHHMIANKDQKRKGKTTVTSYNLLTFGRDRT